MMIHSTSADGGKSVTSEILVCFCLRQTLSTYLLQALFLQLDSLREDRVSVFSFFKKN